MINNRVRYLNESPATIGDNGEKIFRKGIRMGAPVVVSLPNCFKQRVLVRHNELFGAK